MYRRQFKAPPDAADETPASPDSVWAAILPQVGSTAAWLHQRLDRSDRAVRVFISSTFKDFFSEREALLRRVFPALRQHCAGRRLRLVEVDLRWGVPDDASGTEEAVLACLREVERCQGAGASFFLGLVGHRYGWTPAVGRDVGPDAAQHFAWVPGASVTLMEMLVGAFRPRAAQALVAVRSDDFLDHLPAEHRAAFDDAPNDEAVRQLRAHLTSGDLLPADQVFEYAPCFAGTRQDSHSGGKARVHLEDLDAFCDTVLDFFRARISERADALDGDDAAQPGEDVEELQEDLVAALGRLTIGRDALLDRVEAEMDTGPGLVVLTGPAGAGKSTLMAALVRHLLAGQRRLFFHFAGAGGQSAAEECLLERLRTFLGAAPAADVAPLLQTPSPEPPLLLLFDALDELSAVRPRPLSWLPEPLPRGLRVVVSCLDGVPAALRDRADLAELPVGCLDPLDARQMALRYFADFGKRLDAGQEAALLAGSAATNPLWLSQACEALRAHGDRSSLLRLIQALPGDLGGLSAFILGRLAEDDRSGLLMALLRHLLIARAGLLESEAPQLLSEAGGEAEKGGEGEEGRVPAALWLSALHRLRPLLHFGPGGRLRLKHRVVAAAVAPVAFPEEQQRLAWHLRAAEFYQRRCADDAARMRELPFHLFFGGARGRLAAWLRSQDSHFGGCPAMRRTALMQNLRCRLPAAQGDRPLMCTHCRLRRTLGPFLPNQNACYVCCRPAMGKDEAALCHQHAGVRMGRRDHCFLCDRPAFPKQQTAPVRLCAQCGFGDRCCVIVTESDRLYRPRQLPWHVPIIPSVPW